MKIKFNCIKIYFYYNDLGFNLIILKEIYLLNREKLINTKFFREINDP